MSDKVVRRKAPAPMSRTALNEGLPNVRVSAKLAEAVEGFRPWVEFMKKNGIKRMAVDGIELELFGIDDVTK